MSTVAIPNWSSSGVLPPINPESPTAAERSPYEVSLTDFVLRFNTSKERHAVLAGLLDFREGLHNIGLVRGFHWIDGSFVEDVETTEKRHPRDVDVVTFFYLPEGQSQIDLVHQHPEFFNHAELKRRYSIDAFFVQLDANSPEPLVEQSAYWYSMWSHRRSGEWKGYLKIDLTPANDQGAKANLVPPQAQGGQP
jgi:hypothetical protein